MIITVHNYCVFIRKNMDLEVSRATISQVLSAIHSFDSSLCDLLGFNFEQKKCITNIEVIFTSSTSINYFYIIIANFLSCITVCGQVIYAEKNHFQMLKFIEV